MQSTVIELSRSASDDKPSNSEWTTRLSTPVKVENGDYIMVKQAFIDTRLVDSNSILIEQDIQWTLQFMFWVQGHGISQFRVDNINPNHQPTIYDFVPDGLPYYLTDLRLGTDPASLALSKTPVVDSFTINIPKGIYERGFLADFITKQLQGINQPPNINYGNTKFTNGQITPVYDDDSLTFKYFSAPVNNGQPQTVITPFQKPLMLGQFVSGTDPTFTAPMIMVDTFGNYIPCGYTPMTTLGTYSIPLNNPTFLVTCCNLGVIFFDAQPQTPFLDKNLYNIYDGSIAGAQQVSFVYDDNNGDGRFSFQYMHTPLINGANETVGIYMPSSGNDVQHFNIAYANAFSGIMFVGMYTNLSGVDGDVVNDPFFMQLGINYNDFVSPDIPRFMNHLNRPGTTNTFVGFDFYNTFLPYTTRNFMSLGALVNATTQNVTSASNTYKIVNNSSYYTNVFATTATEGYTFTDSSISVNMKASNPPISSTTNAGHYLVELMCSYENDFIGQDKNYQVKAIVGSFYLSPDSFTMSMGPDSYVYQHKGEPVSLASVKIRILNPVTKEPEVNMGVNSTVYLQVTKEAPPVVPTKATTHTTDVKTNSTTHDTSHDSTK